MTKASVNFQPVRSAAHAVLHVSREVSPSYLLPQQQSFGTIVVVHDRGAVAATMREKLALASPQARAKKNYSPLWEGVINLRRPESGESVGDYRNSMSAQVEKWIKKYEVVTGHKVLRADVHLDEGHIDNGKVLLNAHAHVIADRTDVEGKVMRVDATKLRLIQTITAQATGLERGRQSKRKHLPHQAYRHLAEQGRLNVQQAGQEAELFRYLVDAGNQRGRAARDKAAALATELEALKASYTREREALKASGQATQQAYHDLKAAHEIALSEMMEAKAELKKIKAREVMEKERERLARQEKPKSVAEKWADTQAELRQRQVAQVQQAQPSSSIPPPEQEPAPAPAPKVKEALDVKIEKPKSKEGRGR